MKEKKLLTEENYRKGKKKVMIIALTILIIGILLGGSLIVTGIVKTNEAKKQNEQSAQQIEKDNQTRTLIEVQKNIDETQLKIDALKSKISDLEIEQDKIFREDQDFSDRYYEKDKEIKTNQKELSKLEKQLSSFNSELWKIKSGYNDMNTDIEKAKNTVSTSKYIPLYIIGGFIIAASCMLAFAIYMFGKRREIAAFAVQQIMPVAQEGIEKVAPAIGSAAQTIAKGIKQGIKDDDSQQE